jgi:hypothetical protein
MEVLNTSLCGLTLVVVFTMWRRRKFALKVDRMAIAIFTGRFNIFLIVEQFPNFFIGCRYSVDERWSICKLRLLSFDFLE